MKLLITVLFLFFTLFSFGQTQVGCDVIYDLTIPYQPAILQLLTDTSVITESNINTIGKITYIGILPGYYKIRINGPGQKEEIKDNIFVEDGLRLVLNLKINGPCLYDHPANYIPTCPRNHTDSIIPISYGLISTTGEEFNKNKEDEKVRYGGCVTSGCDPKFYCKKHKIEF